MPSEKSLSTIRAILKFEGNDPAVYWRRFVILLTLAVTIATMGLLRNSAAVVIAAMLVAPLMTPILGIASSIVMGWTGRAIRLLVVVCVAASFCVAVAWLLVWIVHVPDGSPLPPEVLGRTAPGVEDLVIALAAGIAGAYVQIRQSEASLLPGAAIGVSLVPPLAAAGILLRLGEPDRAYRAVLLFATNFGAIILAACSVYIVLGAGTLVLRKGRRTGFSLGIGATVAFLAFIFGQLALSTYERHVATGTEAALVRKVKEWASPVPIEVVRVDVQPRIKLAEIWAIIDLPPSAERISGSAADLLPRSLDETPFRAAAREVLGSEYAVIVRFQTRFAWLIDLSSGTVHDVPVTEPPLAP